MVEQELIIFNGGAIGHGDLLMQGDLGSLAVPR